MKSPLRLLPAVLLLVLCLIPSFASASPVMVYNDTQVAIFGSGNPDTGWTTSTDANLGLSVSLRAKNRTTGATPNDGAGTYSFANAPAPRGLWNYEFSINSGNAPLTTFDYYLTVGSNASPLLTTIAPLPYWLDNSYGTSATLNGQGVEGLSILLASSNTIAQNSQNITFANYPGGPLPLSQNATYSYNLFAVQSGAGVNGARLVDTSIMVIVGEGSAAASVPDSGTSAGLLALGLAGLGGIGIARRRLAAPEPSA